MGGEAKGKMHGGKYDNILIIIIKLPVNPNINFIYTGVLKFEQSHKPHIT